MTATSVETFNDPVPNTLEDWIADQTRDPAFVEEFAQESLNEYRIVFEFVEFYFERVSSDEIHLFTLRG